MGSLAEIGGHLKLLRLLLQCQAEDDNDLGTVTLLFQLIIDKYFCKGNKQESYGTVLNSEELKYEDIVKEK
uniref:Uncharacterized protein n=1 Tax=Oryza glumipatula TaxID=40148 RepID=A0A0E0AJ88_9ORYZ